MVDLNGEIGFQPCPIAYVIQILGRLALMIGWLTGGSRAAGLGKDASPPKELLANCTIIAEHACFRDQWTIQAGMIGWLKAVSMAAGLVCSVSSPGNYKVYNNLTLLVG